MSIPFCSTKQSLQPENLLKYMGKYICKSMYACKYLSLYENKYYLVKKSFKISSFQMLPENRGTLNFKKQALKEVSGDNVLKFSKRAPPETCFLFLFAAF